VGGVDRPIHSRSLIALAALLVVLPACGALFRGGAPDQKPGVNASALQLQGGSDEASASPAGGDASCPLILAEVQAAVPNLSHGPDVGQPVKNVVADCSFTSDETDASGRPASVGILVFDATSEGIHMWDSARSDPNVRSPSDIPGIGDNAFVAGSPNRTDLFAVAGNRAIHIFTTFKNGLTPEQFAQLARAAFSHLQGT
jgi:hypothetical protein